MREAERDMKRDVLEFSKPCYGSFQRPGCHSPLGVLKIYLYSYNKSILVDKRKRNKKKPKRGLIIICTSFKLLFLENFSYHISMSNGIFSIPINVYYIFYSLSSYHGLHALWVVFIYPWLDYTLPESRDCCLLLFCIAQCTKRSIW